MILVSQFVYMIYDENIDFPEPSEQIATVSIHHVCDKYSVFRLADVIRRSATQLKTDLQVRSDDTEMVRIYSRYVYNET